MWLATGAFGISKEDLLEVRQNSFLYRFHIYYTVASTFCITQTPIPGDVINFKVMNKDTDVKLWKNYLHELRQLSNGSFYAQDDGPVGTYWDEDKQNL